MLLIFYRMSFLKGLPALRSTVRGLGAKAASKSKHRKMVQDAIKVNKKVVIDGGVTNAIITLTNTIKVIKGFGQFLDNVSHF